MVVLDSCGSSGLLEVGLQVVTGSKQAQTGMLIGMIPQQAQEAGFARRGNKNVEELKSVELLAALINKENSRNGVPHKGRTLGGPGTVDPQTDVLCAARAPGDAGAVHPPTTGQLARTVRATWVTGL